MSTIKEVWLRGETVEGLSPYLQPAAHALLQAGEEITALMDNFPEGKLWESLSGMATPGFHLKHIAGVQDRLLTYAEGNLLTNEQLQYLNNEKVADKTLSELVSHLNTTIQQTIQRLNQFSDEELKAFRGVGRQQIPSTVIGLCFHAAEHTMRHTGQLLVTVKLLKQ
ncbi:MAG: metal-dependent hydrolase [Sphingobacteriales bacterium 41-5]|nr:MAG: metal-dependent hydrolase [Sphingobacteriales bacterium 41-5]